MKEFSCGDVVPGCRAHFSFATQEEVLSHVVEHARADHGITEVTAELAQQVIANIRTVAA